MNYDIKVPINHTVRGIAYHSTRPENIIVETTFHEFSSILSCSEESEQRFMMWLDQCKHACTGKVVIELERE